MADAMFSHLEVGEKNPRENVKRLCFIGLRCSRSQLRVKCDLQCVFAVQMVVIEPFGSVEDILAYCKPKEPHGPSASRHAFCQFLNPVLS